MILQATSGDKLVGGVLVLLALFIWVYYTLWTIVTVRKVTFFFLSPPFSSPTSLSLPPLPSLSSLI